MVLETGASQQVDQQAQPECGTCLFWPPALGQPCSGSQASETLLMLTATGAGRSVLTEPRGRGRGSGAPPACCQCRQAAAVLAPLGRLCSAWKGEQEEPRGRDRRCEVRKAAPWDGAESLGGARASGPGVSPIRGLSEQAGRGGCLCQVLSDRPPSIVTCVSAEPRVPGVR